MKSFLYSGHKQRMILTIGFFTLFNIKKIRENTGEKPNFSHKECICWEEIEGRLLPLVSQMTNII